jgi:hypothetical protein
MTKKILVELDGVISRNEHRRGIRRNMEDYHAAANEDDIDENMVEILDGLSNIGDSVIFSLRPEIHRQETMDWLNDHNVPCDELLLRPDGDWSSEHDLRMEFAEETFKGNLDKHICIMLDNERAVEELREQGFKVGQWSFG